MSQETVEAVRRAYARMARGDFSMYEQLGDDYELVTTPEMPDAGTYRGEAARAWLREWVASFEDLTIEAVECIDAGDRVLAEIVQRGAPRGSGAPLEGRWWQISTFRGAELIRTELLRSGTSRAEALEVAEQRRHG